MKRFLVLLCMFGLFTVSITGCSVVRSSQHSAPLKVNVTADLKADIEVGKRISGRASETYLFGLIPFWWWPDDYVTGVDYYYGGDRDLIVYNSEGETFDLYAKVKAAAAYNAIKDSGADVLVAPRYEIENSYYILFSRTVATVTGFKGKIKGFKEYNRPRFKIE